MSEVTRYTVSSGGFLIEDVNGMVLYEDYAALKAERDALAADNLALKSFIEDECYTLGDGLKYDGLLHAATQSMPINPATDAYANQLRAEELSAAVEIINEKTADYGHGTLEWEVCHWLAITLNRKAANLRKENSND